jgi:hypothetical protein
MKPGKIDAIISSPPYAETLQGSGGARLQESETFKISRSQPRGNGYGGSEGNLGNLKPGDVDAIVSSPPFENCDQRGADHSSRGGYFKRSTGKAFGQGKSMTGYPNSEGQLGQDKGPTFWEAAKEIVQQCHQILKPGGHAIWVTKRFVRGGKVVEFSQDWAKLCESVGFETVCWHKAMLVKETCHDSLFGGKIVEVKARKSFFRRLAEAKGSPAIDWEDVICMRKGKEDAKDTKTR